MAAEPLISIIIAIKGKSGGVSGAGNIVIILISIRIRLLLACPPLEPATRGRDCQPKRAAWLHSAPSLCRLLSPQHPLLSLIWMKVSCRAGRRPRESLRRLGEGGGWWQGGGLGRRRGKEKGYREKGGATARSESGACCLGCKSFFLCELCGVNNLLNLIS